MPLSAKERMARWRQRKRDDPEAHERYKLAERERYQRKKERGVVKMVSDMTNREKRYTRKRWNTNSRCYREKRKLINYMNINTPPESPEGVMPQQAQDFRPNINRSASMRKSIKKRRRASNAKCYRENKNLKVKLQFQVRLTEKYKKRVQRLNKRHPKKTEYEEREIADINEHFTVRKYRLFKPITKNIRQRYNATKSYNKKRMIANLILRYSVVKKYGIGTVAQSVLGISRRHLCPKNPKPFSSKKLKIKEDVEIFLSRDDNSAMKSDKQATITRHGLKKQVRLLRDDMKNLHVKFKAEHRAISYSLFCKLRPFWIVRPTEKDRQTCMCKIHDNLRLKLRVAIANQMYSTADINQLATKLVCDEGVKDCMYRECKSCCIKELDYNDGGNAGKQLEWSVWKNKRVERESKVVSMTVKEKDFGTKATLAAEISKEMNRACRHIFNIRQQYKSLHLLRQKMSHEEIVMHIDFSENYCCKYADEVQSVHFGASRRQISLHTGVAYYGKQVISFTTVSDNLQHGPPAIWAHLDPVLKYLTSKEKFTTIHFISDGPTTQYRNKSNFYLWSTRLYEYGFKQSTWNFLESSHGKGAADGVGAAIKRNADKQVLVHKKDITCSKDFLQTVSADDSKVVLFLIDDKMIDELEVNIPADLKSVPGTMKIHQLLLISPGQFSVRDVSCFCAHPGAICHCYKPTLTSFAVKRMEPTEVETCIDSVQGTEAKKSKPAAEAETELERVSTVEESLIGRYLVVKYDGLPFPGVVQDVDEDEVEVKAMHRVGKNRYFWPMIEDVLWYSRDNIITLLPSEPEPVTSRHCQIMPNIWRLVENEIDT